MQQGVDFATVVCNACGTRQNNFSFKQEGPQNATCVHCGSVGAMVELQSFQAEPPPMS